MDVLGWLYDALWYPSQICSKSAMDLKEDKALWWSYSDPPVPEESLQERCREIIYKEM